MQKFIWDLDDILAYVSVRILSIIIDYVRPYDFTPDVAAIMANLLNERESSGTVSIVTRIV